MQGDSEPQNNAIDEIGAFDSDNYDDEPEETIRERLWGLTEMFPEPFRIYAGMFTDVAKLGVKKAYAISCGASWIVFTSAVILFGPVVLETERAQLREKQRAQDKQILLGPASAMMATDALDLPKMRE